MTFVSLDRRLQEIMRSQHFFGLSFIAGVLAVSPLQLAHSATLAADDASKTAYSNGWQAGDNGGTGFGAWTFAFSGKRNDFVFDPPFFDPRPLAGGPFCAPPT